MSSLLATENSGRLSHPQQRYCACPLHSGPLAVDCCFRRVLELRTLLLPSNLCNGPARFSGWAQQTTEESKELLGPGRNRSEKQANARMPCSLDRMPFSAASERVQRLYAQCRGQQPRDFEAVPGVWKSGSELVLRESSFLVRLAAPPHACSTHPESRSAFAGGAHEAAGGCCR